MLLCGKKRKLSEQTFGMLSLPPSRRIIGTQQPGGSLILPLFLQWRAGFPCVQFFSGQSPVLSGTISRVFSCVSGCSPAHGAETPGVAELEKVLGQWKESSRTPRPAGAAEWQQQLRSLVQAGVPMVGNCPNLESCIAYTTEAKGFSCRRACLKWPEYR